MRVKSLSKSIFEHFIKIMPEFKDLDFNPIKSIEDDLQRYSYKNLYPICKHMNVYMKVIFDSNNNIVSQIKEYVSEKNDDKLCETEDHMFNIDDYRYIQQKVLCIYFILIQHLFYHSKSTSLEINNIGFLISKDGTASMNIMFRAKQFLSQDFTQIIKPSIQINMDTIKSNKIFNEISFTSGFDDDSIDNNDQNTILSSSLIDGITKLYKKKLPSLFEYFLKYWNGFSIVYKKNELEYLPLNTYLNKYSFIGFLSYTNTNNKYVNLYNDLIMRKWNLPGANYTEFLGLGKIKENEKYAIPFAVASDGSFYSLYEDMVMYNSIDDNNTSRVIAPSFDNFINLLHHKQ